MTLGHLIDRWSADQYWFSGAQYLAERPFEPHPLEISCSTFVKDKSAIQIEGTYRHARGVTSHPFVVSIPFNSGASPLCELRCSHLGTVSGQIYELGGQFVAILSSAGGNALSYQFSIDKAGAVHGKGAVKAGELRFAFVANGRPGHERENLGNVVGILGGRRA